MRRFRKENRERFLPLYHGKFLRPGPEGYRGALPPFPPPEDGGYLRQCGQDKYKRDDCLRVGTKIQRPETEGNFNNEIGLPLTIFNIREDHEAAILEMGISDFGEMERLAKVARPDVCVLTNIGCAHLEQLKSREGILKAKTEMFLYMNPEGDIILNGDDDMLASVKPANHIEPVFFGLNPDLAYYADEIENLGLKGTAARFHTPDSEFRAHISIPGAHMVYNALAAIAVGRVMGMNDKEIRQGIESLAPFGRTEPSD